MFNFIADPFLNIFLSKLSAPSGLDTYMFIGNSTFFISLTIIVLLSATALVFPYFYSLFQPTKEIKIPLPIYFSIAAIFLVVSISMLVSTNIAKSPEEARAELAHRYIQKQDVESAFFIQPNYQPTGAKEFSYMKKYKGKNENVYLSIAKTYKSGLDDVAKNKSLAFVYDSIAMDIIRGKAFAGDLSKIIYLLPVSTPDQLSIYLIPVKRTCNNAESAYAAAAKIFASFEKAKKEHKELDLIVVSDNAKKIEILTKWAAFSEKGCIPIWNKYH